MELNRIRSLHGVTDSVDRKCEKKIKYTELKFSTANASVAEMATKLESLDAAKTFRTFSNSHIIIYDFAGVAFMRFIGMNHPGA